MLEQQQKNLRGYPNPRDKRLKVDDLDLKLNQIAEQRNCDYGDILLEAEKRFIEKRSPHGPNVWVKFNFPAPRSNSFWDRVHNYFRQLPFQALGMREREVLAIAAREYLEELEAQK